MKSEIYGLIVRGELAKALGANVTTLSATDSASVYLANILLKRYHAAKKLKPRLSRLARKEAISILDEGKLISDYQHYGSAREDEILQRAKALSKENRGMAIVRLLMAKILTDRKDYKNARKQILGVVDNYPEAKNLFLSLARIDIYEKKYSQALSNSKKANDGYLKTFYIFATSFAYPNLKWFSIIAIFTLILLSAYMAYFFLLFPCMGSIGLLLGLRRKDPVVIAWSLSFIGVTLFVFTFWLLNSHP
jgi:hypothetical protein